MSPPKLSGRTPLTEAAMQELKDRGQNVAAADLLDLKELVDRMLDSED